MRTRRLRGGLGARMHVLDIERPGGARFKVSLRRFERDHRFSTPEHVAHEYRILQLVEEAGIPAPRPLLADAEGRLFGVPAIVAINRFPADADDEIQAIVKLCKNVNVDAIECNHWSDGGAGTEDLATSLVKLVDAGKGQFQPLYDDSLSLWEKIEQIAKKIYGAEEVIADKKVRQLIKQYQKDYGHFQICMAKTQYSFSTDPNLMGAPSHHVVPIREVRLATGAEFLVVVCGNIMTMPGLPVNPSAHDIHLDELGQIEGLF